jgi:hypothetical protein
VVRLSKNYIFDGIVHILRNALGGYALGGARVTKFLEQMGICVVLRYEDPLPG